jgi:hypothetical protein
MKVQIIYLITNLILEISQIIASTQNGDVGSRNTCSNNLFEDGNARYLNVVFWFVTRFIINYSGNIAVLVLFWKSKPGKKSSMYYRNESLAQNKLIDFFDTDTLQSDNLSDNSPNQSITKTAREPGDTLYSDTPNQNVDYDELQQDQ